MSTYYAGETAHSIAVRKVFGGTVESETRRAVMEYMVSVLIGAVIAVLAVLMAFLSVLWQTLRAAITNPAEALKKE